VPEQGEPAGKNLQYYTTANTAPDLDLIRQAPGSTCDDEATVAFLVGGELPVKRGRSISTGLARQGHKMSSPRSILVTPAPG
jgi:hypothetical protein